ncbi:MAG: membrane dipeptidase [Caldilineaceae bacterium]|nr:membrane dipeptidase [Caldilineaceae bacterium]
MMTTIDIDPNVLAFHEEIVIFDGLTSSPITAEQAERMQQGGLTGANMTASWVDADFQTAAQAIAKVRRDIKMQNDKVLVATTVAEIVAAKQAGRTAIVIGFQNGKPVEDEIDFLDVLFHMGLRIMQLTYNEKNYIGDGCTELRDGGLSRFGVDLIHRMAEIGVVVDLSHCSEQTCLDAINASSVPVIISHANPSALIPNPRNKSDKTLEALAERGGVVGACAWSPLLARDPHHRPTLEDLLDSIDYLVALLGIDHVGIGTDMGEGTYVKAIWDALYLHNGEHSQVTRMLGNWWQFETRFPEEVSSVVNLPHITAGLVRRGYNEQQIKQLWGLNFLRVFEQVWGA